MKLIEKVLLPFKVIFLIFYYILLFIFVIVREMLFPLVFPLLGILYFFFPKVQLLKDLIDTFDYIDKSNSINGFVPYKYLIFKPKRIRDYFIWWRHKGHKESSTKTDQSKCFIENSKDN